MRVSRNRRGQRGQVVVVTALVTILLFGIMSMAVDLGLLTNDQKSLQNVSDSAVIAAVADLPSGGAQSAIDAFYTVGQNRATASPFSAAAPDPAWTAWTPSPGTNWCAATGFCYLVKNPVAGQKISIWYSTPPTSIAIVPAGVLLDSCFSPSSPSGPHNPAYNTTYYAETDICEPIKNNFAGLIGQATSLVASHSIAYHFGPAGPTGWALFSSTLVTSGNSPEAIAGDVYAGTGYNPQSNGQASVCAYKIAGAGGHIVYGGPQPPASVPPSMPEPQPINYGFTNPDCSTASGGTVNAEQPAGNCPASSVWNASVPTAPSNGVCLSSPALAQPNLRAPALCMTAGCAHAPCPAGSVGMNGPQGLPLCSIPACTVDSTLTAGVYEVTAARCPSKQFTVDLSTSVKCVSFVVDDGFTVNFINGPKTQGGGPTPPTHLSAYGSSAVNVPGTATTVALVFNDNCPAATVATDDLSTTDRMAIWAAPQSTVTVQNNTNGCCHNYVVAGTIYLPGASCPSTPCGTVTMASNSAITVLGQAYVGTWDIQTGNHPNPDVRYDPNNGPSLPEVVRLVE